jgi:hypothetical protein
MAKVVAHFGRDGHFDHLPGLQLLLPSGEKVGLRGRVLAITLQPSGTASVPLTQRAFRTAAAVRVTFLLLAQNKSNPKKMASGAGSTA